MTVRVGINGFGRIGRNFYRAVLASGADIEVVAFDDLFDDATQAHLLKYDSILGRLAGRRPARRRRHRGRRRRHQVLRRARPRELPWGEVGADVVIESTGFFTDGLKAKAHFEGGAKKVIISAPAKDDDITVVMGVNHGDYDPATHNIISNASCTTNCLAPMAKVHRRRVRHREGPDDDDPRVHPGPEPAGRPAQGPSSRPRGGHQHRADLDRCRQGHRPGPAAAQGQAGRVRAARPGADRFGHRPDCEVGRETTVDEVNAAVKAAAESTLKGYLKYTADEIVSSDIVTDPSSCIFDSGLTKVIGNQVKVVGWYDNEWGYSNRLLDLVNLVGKSL